MTVEFREGSPCVKRKDFFLFGDVAFGQGSYLGVDGVLQNLVLRLFLFKHIAIVNAGVADRLEEMFEHASEKAFERGKPVEHTDTFRGGELDFARVVEVCCHLIEQVVLLGGEIALIEVIADDEHLEWHSLEVGGGHES